MADLKFIRENPEWYRKQVEKRMDDFLLKAFEDFIKIDKEWRELKKKGDYLRSKKNKISLEINEKRKKGEDIEQLIRESRKIAEELKSLEEKEKELEKKRYEISLLLPSPIDDDVPVGGEDDFVIIGYGNEQPKVYSQFIEEFKKENNTEFIELTYEPKSHYDLVNEFGLVDTETAGKIAGSRFYIEKNQLVFLDLAIIMHALDFFKKKGFEYVLLPPYMIKHEIEKRITHYETFRDAIFHVKEDNLLLITTSEHPIAAMFMDKNLRMDQIPFRILAWSPAFRREAGSHGKDTKGIFRVKQFHKVELHSITTLEEQRKELDFLVDCVKQYLNELELPFRIIKLASGDMDKRARIQIDFETWFPGQGKYRETHSLATMGDWISRKINLKIRNKYAANLYSTGSASQRMICAILENYYDPNENVIKIPRALWKYLDFREINIKS